MGIKLKGRETAVCLTEQTAKRAQLLKERGITPTLAIIRVGERDDDIAYERAAIKRCAQAQLEARQYVLPQDILQDELLKVIDKLNNDNSVHGVLIMRPLPKHISDTAVIEALSPQKDVDGITEGSMAAVYCNGSGGFAPCTAQACVEILKTAGVPMSKKRAVVMGRSLVIGKPVAMLLLKENMTVTICHSKTENAAEICREADVIIAAIGKAGAIDESFVSEGQTVLDVGIHATANGELCGDVKTEEVLNIVEAITPVPGGVGAVTTSVLISHVVQAAERMNEKEI